jgi:hypothetical protein
LGDTPFDPGATASSGLPVTYTSSDPSIASVSGSTITIHKAGVVVITVSQPVYIYIGPEVLGPVGNEWIGKAAVWSHGNTLYIRVARADVANIYSSDGLLVKRIDLQEGLLSETLPKGVYIVTLQGGGAYKVIIQ